MKLSRICMLFAAAAVLATIPACKKDSGRIKVAIVTNNPEDFWKICESGAQKAAKDFDVELIFRMPDNADVGNQMKIVKSLTEQGIAGIAVSVIDPKEQADELKQIAAKTKLVTMDNDADGSNRICYVGTDNYAAGREVGRLVKETMPGGGDVAIFVGQITPINARQRFQGVVDELAGAGQKDVQGEDAKRKVGDREIFFRKYGDYFLYNGEAITDKANKENALANAKNALEILGDRDNVCMVGLWAYNPPKILEAIASKSFTKTKVVGCTRRWCRTLITLAIDQSRSWLPRLATISRNGPSPPFRFASSPGMAGRRKPLMGSRCKISKPRTSASNSRSCWVTDFGDFGWTREDRSDDLVDGVKIRASRHGRIAACFAGCLESRRVHMRAVGDYREGMLTIFFQRRQQFGQSQSGTLQVQDNAIRDERLQRVQQLVGRFELNDRYSRRACRRGRLAGVDQIVAEEENH